MSTLNRSGIDGERAHNACRSRAACQLRSAPIGASAFAVRAAFADVYLHWCTAGVRRSTVAWVAYAEVELTAELVRELLWDQHPDLADRPIALGARGWDSQLWRLGDDLAVRLPWQIEDVPLTVPLQ